MGFRRAQPGRFGNLIGVWLILSLAFLLLSATLEELLPERGFSALLTLLVSAGPALLIAAGILWAMRRRTWKTPAAVIGALALVTVAAAPLDYISVRLNFMRHKPVYDSIVRDAMAGHSIGRLSPNGNRYGVRSGVDFSFRPNRPLVVSFQWKTSAMMIRKVEYHERPVTCPKAAESGLTGQDPPILCVASPELWDGYVFSDGIV